MTDLAPIVLFVYNRPKHTRKTLEALSKNILANESKLFIYANGPNENDTEEQLNHINDVRKIIREKKWCKEVEIIERKKNIGLSNSIIAGITEIVNKYGKIIVLEDDLVTAVGFLKYMNESLNVFENSQNIFNINAYMFPVDFSENKIVLLPYFFSWGWATWKEKWSVFENEPNQKEYIINNIHLRNRFNLADYNSSSILGPETIWDISWYYSIFKRNGLGVFPTHSLVNNIGFDGSGTHRHGYKNLQKIEVENVSIQVRYANEIDLKFYNQLLLFFSNHKKDRNIFKKIANIVSIK